MATVACSGDHLNAPTPSGRLPDFVIIGAAKSGTTTLHQWLGGQPEISATELKEPRFFSRDWGNGLEWYRSLFAGAAADQLVGEASTNYTDQRYCEVAARRMAATIPRARLIYVVRHPVERLRSQYRHNWRRAAESAPLLEAIRRADNPYVSRSLYFSRLSPYLERFPTAQICVVRFEDLVDDTAVPAWPAVLAHLGLDDRPRPSGAHNVTDLQPQVNPALRRLARSRWLRRLPTPPPAATRLAKQALRRSVRRAPADIEVEIPPVILDQLWADTARLETWLGAGPLWKRSG